MIEKYCPQYELIYTETRYANGSDFTCLIIAKYDPGKGRWYSVARHAIFSSPEDGPAAGLAELTRSLDFLLGLDDSAFCCYVESYFKSIAQDFDAEDMLGYPDAAQYDDFQLIRSVRAEFDGEDGLYFVDQIKETEGEHYAD